MDFRFDSTRGSRPTTTSQIVTEPFHFCRLHGLVGNVWCQAERRDILSCLGSLSRPPQTASESGAARMRSLDALVWIANTGPGNQLGRNDASRVRDGLVRTTKREIASRRAPSHPNWRPSLFQAVALSSTVPSLALQVLSHGPVVVFSRSCSVCAFLMNTATAETRNPERLEPR